MPHLIRFRIAAFASALVLTTNVLAAQTPVTAEQFFDDSVVDGIYLTINPRDWNELKANFQLNDYYAAHMTWRNVTVRNVAIRSRGVGSRNGVKPGLRVDFNRFVPSQDFLGLKSVVLRNNTQDPSGLHERLSMLFFTRMGLPASREAHARLYVNGEYVGLYTIVETVDKPFLRTRFGEDDGYLYEYDYEREDLPYYFEYRGPDPALYSPKPFQPQTHELDPDPQPLVDMIEATNRVPDSDFLSVVGRYIDLPTFMTYLAIENFIANIDGVAGDYGMNNFYLYRFSHQLLSTFVPWDESEAFKGGIDHGIWHNIADVPSSLRNRLVEAALRVPSLAARYIDALARCADLARPPAAAAPLDVADGEPGWLEQEISREYQQVRQATLDDRFTQFTSEEFEEEIERLLLFARTRSDVVRRQIAGARER